MNQMASLVAAPQLAPAALPALTPDQQVGAESFFNFLMSDAATFVLSGGAGVGKTFLMGYLCRNVMQEYANACALLGIKEAYGTLVFTATTNKAAEVLEHSLGLPVSTIHSFLGLKVTENFKTGKTTLTRTGNYKVRSRHIVFIDECSMIDTQLYQTILESFKDSKIIFVGDHAQMAPVSEPNSPVFLKVDPQNFIYLAQPVRNAGSPALVKLCAQLRQTVETGVFRPIQAVPGSIEYLDDDTMPIKLKEYFTDLEPSARVLCYTNTRVEAFNEHIRCEVRGLPEEFCVGDTLVVAQTYSSVVNAKERVLNVERDVEVLWIGPVSEDYDYSDAFHDGSPILYREARVRCLTGEKEEFTVKLPVSKEKVVAASKYFSSRKEWSTYFQLKSAFIDLRDKAACTVYKSQGSTYEAVFVDIGNIGTSYDAEQVARMLFVAVSRATTRVFLYGELPARYVGKAEP